MLGAQDSVWLGPAAENGIGVVRPAIDEAYLVFFYPQYFVQTPMKSERSGAMHTWPRWLAPAGGFDRDQVPRRKRVEVQKHGPERRRQWRKLHIGIDGPTSLRPE